LRRQEPPAGEEVELVPCHLAVGQKPQCDQEPEGEERPDRAGRGGRREAEREARAHGWAGSGVEAGSKDTLFTNGPEQAGLLRPLRTGAVARLGRGRGGLLAR